jgi:hypothetical protein
MVISGEVVMKKSIILGILLIVVFVISGCATSTNQVWTRNTPGGTDEELNKDKYDCMRQSQQKVVRAFGGGVVFAETETKKDLFDACMNARGYSLVSK